MPSFPNDYIDPELQDLVGSSSMTEVTKSLRTTPELVIDADPLAELPFETEDPPAANLFSEVQMDNVSGSAPGCAESPKVTRPTANSTLLKSSHGPALKMLIDIVRKNAALRKVRSSDGWDRLLDSMTRYVEAQVAAGGA